MITLNHERLVIRNSFYVISQLTFLSAVGDYLSPAVESHQVFLK